MTKIYSSIAVKKGLFTLFLLFIYVLGSRITLPFVDLNTKDFLGGSTAYLAFSAALTGGNLRSLSIFSVGLSPWMSAMILWQMFSYSKKLGLSSTAIEIQDRRRMYLTLLIAVIQSLAVSLSLPVQSSYSVILVALMNTLLLIAGTFFLVWLSDLNASMGIGGSIVILLSSIVLNIPQDVIETFKLVYIPTGIVVLLVFMTIIFSYLLALMYRARYLVPVNKIGLHNRFKRYSYLEIMLNPAGGMPYMYVMSFLSVPAYLFILLGFIFPNHSGLAALSKEFMVGKPLWVYVYISVLFLFSIIFAFVTMNGEEIADRMKKSGEYIYGIYPGADTSRFINRLVLRFSVIGGLFNVVMAGGPMLFVLFDDTFHQIRLFQEQDIDSRLLVLAYQPHLRYFLYRHGVLETDTYSVFDVMQDFHNLHTQVLSIRDIEWDDDCEFIYSPFTIIVQKNGKKFAKVEHGVEGFISDIQYFGPNGQIHMHYIMDDRGFISSIIFFEDGQAAYQEYLNPKGVWQFREHLKEGGQVEVNPILGYRFKMLTYQNMGDLVAEFFENYLQTYVKDQDIFMLPSHSHHDQLVLDRLPSTNPKLLSLFIGRNPQDTFRDLDVTFEKSDLILVDREDSLRLLQELYPERMHQCYHLSSFDTRLRLGRSQTKKESIIYFQLDFEQGIDNQALLQVLSFVAENKDTEVIFGAFAASQEQMNEVEGIVESFIQENIQSENLGKAIDYGDAENPLEENQHQDLRIQFVNLNDELDLIKTLEFVRLIVDLNRHPHLYTQIAGISAGIPQINLVETVYVEHLKNGYLLADVTEFSKAAHYYTDRLKEWNESLIYSIDKIKEHTGQQFLGKLEKWIEEVKNVKGT
ncbi:accessory Sec system protein Asp1 [Streptococcus pneumoniae]|nr:accessory Sec system protein Asp1 [Streptococcus pneumoniae]COL90172.1 accessory secretory protein Asp1 [Streptococcus pneumoniae]